jgi:hypothetical protein
LGPTEVEGEVCGKQYAECLCRFLNYKLIQGFFPGDGEVEQGLAESRNEPIQWEADDESNLVETFGFEVIDELFVLINVFVFLIMHPYNYKDNFFNFRDFRMMGFF